MWPGVWKICGAKRVNLNSHYGTIGNGQLNPIVGGLTWYFIHHRWCGISSINSITLEPTDAEVDFGVYSNASFLGVQDFWDPNLHGWSCLRYLSCVRLWSTECQFDEHVYSMAFAFDSHMSYLRSFEYTGVHSVLYTVRILSTYRCIIHYIVLSPPCIVSKPHRLARIGTFQLSVSLDGGGNPIFYGTWVVNIHLRRLQGLLITHFLQLFFLPMLYTEQVNTEGSVRTDGVFCKSFESWWRNSCVPSCPNSHCFHDIK